MEQKSIKNTLREMTYNNLIFAMINFCSTFNETLSEKDAKLWINEIASHEGNFYNVYEEWKAERG